MSGSGVYKLYKNRINKNSRAKKDTFSMEMHAVSSSYGPDTLVYEYIGDFEKATTPENVQLQHNTAYGQLSR